MNSKDLFEVISKKFYEVGNAYREIKINPEMDESEMFLINTTNSILSDVERQYISILRNELYGFDPGSEKKELEVHVVNIVKVIDKMKLYLSHVPTLRDRDRMMFQILDDIKIYSVKGEAYLKVENFETFWRLREQLK